MKLNPKKNLITKIIFSNLILLICLLLITFLSTNLIRDYINRRQLNKEVEKLKKEIQGLNQSNEQLKNLLGYLKTPDYLEEEARTKLNKKKPGEEIIIVPEDLTNASSILLEKSSLQENNLNKSNLRRWWEYFFKEKIP